MARSSAVVRPSWGWFFLLDGGILVMAALAFSETVHAAACDAVPAPLPGRRTLQAMCAATAAVHVAEAVAAGRRARRRGLPAVRWALQTFIVGFPSLLKLRRAPAG